MARSHFHSLWLALFALVALLVLIRFSFSPSSSWRTATLEKMRGNEMQQNRGNIGVTGVSTSDKLTKKLRSCLGDIEWPEPVIIIDESTLRLLSLNLCPPIKSGLKIAVTSANSQLAVNVTVKGKEKPIQVNKFTMTNSNATDYTLFFNGTTKYAVPKFTMINAGKMSVPSDIPNFLEFWKESRFIDCLGIQMNRTDTKRQIPLEVVIQIAELRDFLRKNFAMNPLLWDGTLLGWFRECSIISHTHDFDLAVPSEHFTPDIIRELANESQPFWIRRVLGLPADSLELTIHSRHGSNKPSIDLFFLYRSENASYSAGLDFGSRTKFRWEYSWRIERFCSGALLGHLFRVPCEVERVLESQYGPDWAIDVPTSHFGWSSSSKNVKKVGHFDEVDMKEMRGG